jgi:Ca-activated chloride channel family protein
MAVYFKQKAHQIWIKFSIRSLYFFLILIAGLGPSFGAMKKEIQTTGKDVFILLDLSPSMNTRDVAPSRLERIKYELTQLIPTLNADRVGLITFTSEAFLQCPLTYDQSAFFLYSRMLQTNLAPAAGANFRPAFEMALQKFKENTNPNQETEKAKIILLISDGEDFGESIEPVLQSLYNQRIRVFTLGIGSEEGGPVPVGKTFKKNREGERVISRLHPGRLSKIAFKTNGQYFEINNQVNQTEQLLRIINNIEGEKHETQTIDISANKYIYPLLAALVLMVLDILLTVTVIKL